MTAAVVTLALLAILAATALAALTSILHSASRRSTVALESVRMAEEVQRDLLLHDRLRDGPARSQITAALRERLVVARSIVRNEEQGAALARADRTVTDYLDASNARTESPDALSARHAEAFAAIESLLAIEAAEVKRTRERVHHYDELGDVIAVAIATVVVVGTSFTVWWLHARALRPLFGLARTMRRFGSGDVEERATDEGPAEVKQMARNFNEMASAIARQRKERQTFIAGVVHDLRNPLSVLRLSTDLAGGDSQLPRERLVKVLGTVGRQVGRLERMVNDLLESVTIESGRLALRLEDLDARALANEAAELYGSTSAAHTIVLALPDGAVPLRCDGMRIEQVLSNLLSNAIKYSPAGGTVSLELEHGEDGVVFRVRDQGVGMSAEDAAIAFEPFRRSAGMRDQVPGSGLGLYIVRRLVEAHGGRITLRTRPGEGSTFEVTLPATPRGESLDVRVLTRAVELRVG
jgi:signal transduction histidine kinase